jgi:xylose isomerase
MDPTCPAPPTDGYFPTIQCIKYEGPTSKNPLAFKYYNADEVILGKPMREWLRFSLAYWHTWRGTGADMFGPGTMRREWDDGTDSIENALRRVDVNFEFMQKLGIDYFCFHDRDIAPEGKTLAESHKNLEIIANYMKKRMAETKAKLLWGTANLFSAPRYMNGASTNPDSHVFAYAAAQVKKCMDISRDLGAENYVFWGGREGYSSLLNTDMKQELDHMAYFLKLAADYKKEIGFNAQLLIEPKPREPTKHQYDFDSATVVGFLKHYGLDKDYKLNIEANHCTLAGHTFEHELTFASSYGMLGSIDANTGDALLGWDTDQFPMDVKSTTLAMQVIVNQGGLGSGGLNFDAKLRRESTDIEDMFISHIGGMDSFARGLRNVAAMKEEGVFEKMRDERYSSYTTAIGAKIHSRTTNFRELEQWALQAGEPQVRSGKQEKFEMMLNSYV